MCWMFMSGVINGIALSVQWWGVTDKGKEEETKKRKDVMGIK